MIRALVWCLNKDVACNLAQVHVCVCVSACAWAHACVCVNVLVRLSASPAGNSLKRTSVMHAHSCHDQAEWGQQLRGLSCKSLDLCALACVHKLRQSMRWTIWWAIWGRSCGDPKLSQEERQQHGQTSIMSRCCTVCWHQGLPLALCCGHVGLLACGLNGF